jgi:hypothetical protein
MMVGCGWMGEESSVMTDGCGSLSAGLGGVVIWRMDVCRVGKGWRREETSDGGRKAECIRVREHDALVNADNMGCSAR